MANLKSAKKRALQGKKRQIRNQAQKSDIKTLSKKLFAAIDAKDITQAQKLMLLAESKIARAKGKGLLKTNTASRKISMMAKKLYALQKKGS